MGIEIGDRYVIEISAIAELPDGKKKYFIKPFESLVFDRKGLEKLEKFDVQALKEYDKGYQTGKHGEADLEKVWNLAKKILCGKEYGGYSLFDLQEIFDSSSAIYIMSNLTYKEACEKIETYEKKKQLHDEIKPGMEVRDLITGEIAVVLKRSSCDNKMYILFFDGSTNLAEIDDWQPTGLVYEGVVNLLKELKLSDDKDK